MKPADKVTDFKNVHGKQPNKAIAVKRFDHLNILAGDIRAQRDFCVDTLGYREYERIELERRHPRRMLDVGHDRGARADLHQGRVRRTGRARPPAPRSRSGSTRARSVCAPPTSGSRTRSTSSSRPPSTTSPRASSYTATSPGGNRIEVTSGGRLVYAPDEPCVIWTEEDRKKGQAWHNQTVADLPHLRDAAVRGDDR